MTNPNREGSLDRSQFPVNGSVFCVICRSPADGSIFSIAGSSIFTIIPRAMMTHRALLRKPRMIYAERFVASIQPLAKGVYWAGDHFEMQSSDEEYGNEVIEDDDWIITDIDGERYPIKDDIVKMMYKKSLPGGY